jgi:RimJ/RimL family protein N-acetyltransferase
VFTPLQTERLILRRLEPDDAGPIWAYRSLPEVSRYQSWEPRSLSEMTSFVAEQMKLSPDTPETWLQLAITLGESGSLIGDCGIHTLGGADRQAEIGITLSPSHQGKGYAAEALTAVLEYLFTSLGKHRVYGSVDPRNRSSIALLTRLGMRQEAHFRESLWFKGEWADDLIYAILDHEWKARRS